jgi:hypothetical protein
MTYYIIPTGYQATFEDVDGYDRFSAILLKNSSGQLENHYFKNTDLIERSTINDRSSVDGSKTPEIRLAEVLKEFFNTIRPKSSFEKTQVNDSIGVHFGQ